MKISEIEVKQFTQLIFAIESQKEADFLNNPTGGCTYNVSDKFDIQRHEFDSMFEAIGAKASSSRPMLDVCVSDDF